MTTYLPLLKEICLIPLGILVFMWIMIGLGALMSIPAQESGDDD